VRITGREPIKHWLRSPAISGAEVRDSPQNRRPGGTTLAGTSVDLRLPVYDIDKDIDVDIPAAERVDIDADHRKGKIQTGAGSASRKPKSEDLDRPHAEKAVRSTPGSGWRLL